MCLVDVGTAARVGASDPGIAPPHGCAAGRPSPLVLARSGLPKDEVLGFTLQGEANPFYTYLSTSPSTWKFLFE